MDVTLNPNTGHGNVEFRLGRGMHPGACSSLDFHIASYYRIYITVVLVKLVIFFKNRFFNTVKTFSPSLLVHFPSI